MRNMFLPILFFPFWGTTGFLGPHQHHIFQGSPPHKYRTLVTLFACLQNRTPLRNSCLLGMFVIFFLTWKNQEHKKFNSDNVIVSAISIIHRARHSGQQVKQVFSKTSRCRVRRGNDLGKFTILFFLGQ